MVPAFRHLFNSPHSLVGRTLRLAVIRIALVSISAGMVSYFINESSQEEAIRAQLLLSTEQTIQRESLPFREIRELEQNFLADFKAADADPDHRKTLLKDFEQIFYRHEDGSYTQRPGLFEGQPLADGRRYANMSATYSPEVPLTDDIKARFALSFLLSHHYGSATRGRLFNFYGVVPEKGFPIYQDADIAKVFSYTGPEALKLESYEFFSRGFDRLAHDRFMTRMYFDYSNHAWMTTVATPDTPDASGQHRILACVDVLLDELMRRLAHPTIQGAYSTLFLADDEGTLMFHTEHMDDIKQSDGQASIKSLQLTSYYPLIAQGKLLQPGQVSLVEGEDEIVAIARIPETPTLLSIHYPRLLLRPSIFQNLAIVVTLGMMTLLVEIFIIRSILLKQVAWPLVRLSQAAHRLGNAGTRWKHHDLPIQSKDEIGELARNFADMADRIHHAQEQLESKVQERTQELEEANRQLAALSITDGLTGIANRRHLDQRLDDEWRRAKRAGTYLMVAMVDIDWFKKFNDHYGHQAGDECLKQITRILEAQTKRTSDFIARYGGEEFVIIASTTTQPNVLPFVQSICAAVENAQMPHAMSPFERVTVSIGVAGAIPNEDDPHALLAQADAALYRAKASGRNQAVMAD